MKQTLDKKREKIYSFFKRLEAEDPECANTLGPFTRDAPASPKQVCFKKTGPGCVLPLPGPTLYKALLEKNSKAIIARIAVIAAFTILFLKVCLLVWGVDFALFRGGSVYIGVFVLERNNNLRVLLSFL